MKDILRAHQGRRGPPANAQPVSQGWLHGVRTSEARMTGAGGWPPFRIDKTGRLPYTSPRVQSQGLPKPRPVVAPCATKRPFGLQSSSQPSHAVLPQDTRSAVLIEHHLQHLHLHGPICRFARDTQD